MYEELFLNFLGYNLLIMSVKNPPALIPKRQKSVPKPFKKRGQKIPVSIRNSVTSPVTMVNESSNNSYTNNDYGRSPFDMSKSRVASNSTSSFINDINHDDYKYGILSKPPKTFRSKSVGAYDDSISDDEKEVLNKVKSLRLSKPPPMIEIFKDKQEYYKKIKRRSIPGTPFRLPIISVFSNKITYFVHSFPLTTLLKDIHNKLEFNEMCHFIFNKQIINMNLDKNKNLCIKDLQKFGLNVRSNNEDMPIIMFHIKRKNNSTDIDPFQLRIIRHQAISG